MLLRIMLKSKIISHMAVRWALTDRSQAAALAEDLTTDRSCNPSGLLPQKAVRIGQNDAPAPGEAPDM